MLSDNITKMTQKEQKLKKLFKQNEYNEISTLLLNSVYTSTFMDKNKLFENFYDFVAEKFKNDEPMIYQYPLIRNDLASRDCRVTQNWGILSD